MPISSFSPHSQQHRGTGRNKPADDTDELETRRLTQLQQRYHLVYKDNLEEVTDISGTIPQMIQKSKGTYNIYGRYTRSLWQLNSHPPNLVSKIQDRGHFNVNRRQRSWTGWDKCYNNKWGQFSTLQTLTLPMSVPTNFGIISSIKIQSHGVWGEHFFISTSMSRWLLGAQLC